MPPDRIGNGLTLFNVSPDGEVTRLSSTNYANTSQRADDPAEQFPGAFAKGGSPGYWIHVKSNYHCYILYAEYYFEAWLTRLQDPDSERLPVKNLILRWRHGNTTGEEVGEHTAMVSKSDRVYNLGCDTDTCALAIAYVDGREPLAVSCPEMCTWKG